MNFFKIIGFVFVITFCNSAYAETGAACTRAGGAIIANALSPSSDGAAIVTDIDGATGSSCKEIPDFYKLQFYKFGLCTANPFTTGTGSTQDFSSCSWLLNSATAVEHIITYSSTGSLATNSEIATGTYNHLVMVLQNRLSQKHTETFNTTIVGRTGSGTTCWTIASTSAFGGADTITGETLISPNPGASNRATLGIDCGSTANPDYTTEIYEAFGEGTFDTDIEEDAGLKVALLKADGVTKATTISNAKMIMVVMDATYTVKDDSSYSLAFKMTASSSIDLNYQQSETKIYALKIGADPFQVTFTIN